MNILKRHDYTQQKVRADEINYQLLPKEFIPFIQYAKFNKNNISEDSKKQNVNVISIEGHLVFVDTKYPG